MKDGQGKLEMNIKELNKICMEIISYTGEGRSLVHEALDLTLIGNFSEARKKLDAGIQLLNVGHRIQFEDLMAKQMQGEEIPFNLLLSHAMDLLMISTSEKDLIERVLSHKEDNI